LAFRIVLQAYASKSAVPFVIQAQASIVGKVISALIASPLSGHMKHPIEVLKRRDHAIHVVGLQVERAKM
jgi:hypothetical protein